jgi:hypothetical protein
MQRVALVLGLLSLLLWAPQPARAQDQGVAVITTPLEGAAVSGLVPIAGSATHPEFRRYEVAFAYSPNPTDTWFVIGGPATTPVANDVLVRWDTGQISDGLYILRLRVFYGNDTFLETFVPNIRVQNATPTPAPPATLTPEAGLPTATVAPTQAVIALPPTSTPRPSPTAPAAGPDNRLPASDGAPPINGRLIAAAFGAGVRLTLIGFLLLAAYVSLRAALRARPRR